MARKFWERVGGNKIQFYDEPQQVTKDEMQARIIELQTILALPDETKAIIASFNPTLADVVAFDAVFQDELEELADRLDYWDYDQEIESITKVETGWLDPANASLGPATIVSASSFTVGNDPINAIDAINNNMWETDSLGGPHEIRFGWGYSKQIDGIRFRVGASVTNPEALEGVQVWLGQTEASLDNDARQVFDSPVDINVAGTLADPWLEVDFDTSKRGKFCRIEITGSGVGNNRSIIRELELRGRVKTFGL